MPCLPHAGAGHERPPLEGEAAPSAAPACPPSCPPPEQCRWLSPELLSPSASGAPPTRASDPEVCLPSQLPPGAATSRLQVRPVPPLWGRRGRSDPAAGAAPAEGVKGDPCQAGTEAGEGRSACGPRPQSAAALWAGRTWAALPARLIIQGPAPAAGSSFQQAAPDRDRRAGGQERKNHRALLKNGPRFTGLLRPQRWAGQQWDLQAGFADRGAGVGRAGVEASRVHGGA